MAAVRIPEGERAPFPWRRAGLIAGWALSLLIVGGVLGWYLWQFQQDKDALAAEIVSLQARIVDQARQHADQVAALTAAIETLEQQNDELSEELTDCQDNVKGLVQRGDRLESELDE